MTRRHSPIQLLTVTAVAGALMAGGVASAADAPIVSKQGLIFGTALTDFPGTGIEKGEWLGTKREMVYRDVTLEDGQTARFTLKARDGRRIRALGAVENSDLRVTVLDRKYAGRKHVNVRVTVAGDADGEVSERIYALAQQR